MRTVVGVVVAVAVVVVGGSVASADSTRPAYQGPAFNPATSPSCPSGYTLLKFTGGSTFDTGGHTGNSSGDPTKSATWTIDPTTNTLSLTSVTIDGVAAAVSTVIISNNGSGEAYSWNYSPPTIPSSDTPLVHTSSAATPEIHPMTGNQYFFVCAAKAARLTLVKTIVGGTATLADFPLTAATGGIAAINAATSGTAAATATVAPATYTLSEPANADYDAASWVCTNDAAPLAVTASTVAVPAEGSVTCTITNTVKPSGLTLVKEASTGLLTAPDTITYTFTVANTGTRVLTGVGVTDANCDAGTLTGPGGDASTIGALDPAEAWVYTCTRTITQAQIDAGLPVTNTATATATGVDPVTDTVDVPVRVAPSVTIDKIGPGSITGPGPITYTMTVRNTGNVTLTSPVLTDATCPPALTAGDGDGDGQLDVGEVWIYECVRTVDQAQIDSGGTLTNVATIDTDQTPPASDDHDVLVGRSPNFTLAKSSPTDLVSTPQTVTYHLVVDNTGNVTLTSPVITDTNCTGMTGPAGDANPDGRLDITETWTYSCTRAITQADIDAGGDIVNVATADFAETVEEDDRHVIDVVQAPAINIVKSSPTTQITAAGNITYEFRVSNTGNVALTGIAVADPKCLAAPTYVSGDVAGDGELGLTETWLYRCTRVVTQAEVDAGGLLPNTAVVTSDQSDPSEDSHEIPINATPAIDVVKSASLARVAAPGPVTYTFIVFNTGNVTLTGVTVTDPKCAAAAGYTNGDTDADNALDLTERWVYTCDYVVTQADIDAGGLLTNVVTVDSNESEADTDTHELPVIYGPAIRVEKSSTTTVVTEPGTIIYDFVVRNVGNTTLTGVTIADPLCDVAPTPVGAASAGPLAPGDAWEFSCPRSISQAMIDAGGEIVNTVTVDSDQSDPNSDDHDVPVLQTPSVLLTKTSPVMTITAAGPVQYDFRVENTGNVSITGLTLTDPVCSSTPTMAGGDADTDGVLDVGESWGYSCLRTVSQAEVDAGGVLPNTAVVDADQTDPSDDSHDIPVLPVASVDLTKVVASGGPFAIGASIGYTLTATNTGAVTLGGVTISDPGATIGVCTPAAPATLAPAQTMVCTASHTVTAAEATAGTYRNVATAVAQPPNDGPQVRTDDEVSVLTSTLPVDLQIDKSLAGDPMTGQNVDWTIVVRNAGAGSDSGVFTIDALPSSVEYVSGSGTGWTCAIENTKLRCSYAGSVGPNQTLPTLTVTTRVTAPGGASLSNTASVAGTAIDSDPSNNSDTATGTVGLDVARPPVLPKTGAETMVFVLLGIVLAGSGVLLFGLSRIRRRRPFTL